MENTSITKPVFKHKGVKKCEELCEKTFHGILFDNEVHHANQKDLNIKNYRVYAVEVGFYGLSLFLIYFFSFIFIFLNILFR